MTQRYRYCGLELASELALPELPLSESCAPVDLVIRQASVPRRLAAARLRVETYEYNDHEALWRLEGVGRYRVAEAGRLIEVEPAALADAASVRLFLLRPVFALAAVMRGDGILNAAAVERDGQVFAFIGPSASGKSSAAALLVQRGCRLVSDALLRVARDEAGRMQAHPQAPGLWLWPDAVKAFGLDADDIVRPGLGLRRWACPTVERPFPLARVALLREHQGDALELFEPSPRQGRHAFDMLLRQIAGNTWTEGLADRRGLFQWSSRIAQQAVVEQLELPWGWEQLESLGELLDGWTRIAPVPGVSARS